MSSRHGGTGHDNRSTSKGRSSLGFLCTRRLLAFCLKLGELLGRKNSLCLLEECFPTLLRAASLHAFGLPRFDFALLIWSKIQACRIDACRFLSVRHAFCATSFVSCERAGRNEHRSRN